ncbi:MAG: acyltransferase family protein [Massilia sp.]
MRGFAVFLVFLAHYVSLISPWIANNAGLENFAEALHAIGNIGVDLFFVLSGYLIYRSIIGRKQDLFLFFQRRVDRIYPAFLVVFALYLAISVLRPADSKIVGAGVDACLYVLQNLLLLPGLFPITPVITVAWSLSYEMMYYIAIPVLVTLFQMRERSAQWRVRFFLIVACLIAGYSALFAGHVRLIMFISGILLHEALRSRSLKSPGSAAAFAALIVALAITVLPSSGSMAYTGKVIVLFVAFFTVCYSCFTRPGEWLAQRFSWAPLRWLGNMSYSYYLLHGLTLKIAFAVLAAKAPTVADETVFFFLLMPVMFAVTLVPAAMLFLVVERPVSLTSTRPRPSAARPVGAARHV